MKRGVIVAVGFVGFTVYTSYILLTGSKYVCDVCILYNDIEVCQKVEGMEENETVVQGVSTACGGAANGRKENIECSQTPPTKAVCKPI